MVYPKCILWMDHLSIGLLTSQILEINLTLTSMQLTKDGITDTQTRNRHQSHTTYNRFLLKR